MLEFMDNTEKKCNQVMPDREMEILQIFEKWICQTKAQLGKDSLVQSGEQSVTIDFIQTLFCDLKQNTSEMLAQLGEKIAHRNANDAEIAEKNKRFEQIYDELQKYKNGFDKIILKPYLEYLMELYETHAEMLTCYEKKFQFDSTTISDRERNLLTIYNNMGKSIEHKLYRLGIERIPVKCGEPFNPQLYEALEIVETSNVEQDAIIAEELSVGWREVATGQVIQYPQVAVFKFENKEN